MNNIRLTQNQFDELNERKTFLEEVAIPKNSQEIERAKDFGDLSENAEYHSAKDYQAILIQELNEIKVKLNKSTIIKGNQTFDKVDIGHTVTVNFINEDSKITFDLIGEDGDGINEIDINSKLGKSVLGKSVGEKFSYEANDPSLGELHYELISIE